MPMSLSHHRGTVLPASAPAGRRERLLCLGLAALSALAIGFGSLLPFDMSIASAWPPAAALARVGAWADPSWLDLAINVAIAAILGFWLMGAAPGQSRRGWGLIAAAVAVTAACASWATILEVLQGPSATRVSAWSDVMAQAAGGALGAALWAVAGGPALGWLGPARGGDRRAVAHRLPVPYVLVCVLLQLSGAPMLPTFHPGPSDLAVPSVELRGGATGVVAPAAVGRRPAAGRR